MSNPYAPPEERPREVAPGEAPAEAHPGLSSDGTVGPDSVASAAPGGTTTAPRASSGPTSAQHGPAPIPPPGPFYGTGRSPEGVPYARPQGAPQAMQPPNPADLLRLGRLFRATGVLVLVAVIGDLLSFPWFVAAGLVTLVAIVVGVRALALATKTRQRSQRTVLVLLLLVSVLSLVRPATALLTWDAESAFARCQAAAITVQGQNACVTEYQQALNDRVAQLTRRTPAP